MSELHPFDHHSYATSVYFTPCFLICQILCFLSSPCVRHLPDTFEVHFSPWNYNLTDLVLLLCQWVCKDTWRSNAEPLRAATGWPTHQPWWGGHTRTHGRRVRVSSGPHPRVEEIGWALIPESLQKDRMLVGTGKKICIASTYFPQNNQQVRNLYFLFLLSLQWKISGFWRWWTLWDFFTK